MRTQEITVGKREATMLENIARYNDTDTVEIVELMCEFIDQVCKYYNLIQNQFQYDLRKGGRR